MFNLKNLDQLKAINLFKRIKTKFVAKTIIFYHLILLTK